MDELKALVQEQAARISALEQRLDALSEELQRVKAKLPEYEPGHLLLAEKIQKNLDAKADAARERLRQKGFAG